MSTQTIQQQIPAGIYVADPVHSSIGFAVTHNGVSTFRSGFADYEVRLSGGENPRLVGTVDVSSIEIDEPQLKGHLLSPEFFEAERHPQLRFESSELDVAEDRRSFGLDWQAELPSGGEVLDYEVDIAVELELVEEAE